MKLSKNLGRVATTFLATAMLAGVSAVPAFAAEEDVIPASNNSITIHKAIDMKKAAEGAGVPDATFKFTIGAGQPADGVKVGDMTAITNTDADGMEGFQVAVDSESFTDEDQDGVYLADLTLSFNPAAFADTGAGVYRYTFKEEACSVAGMDTDSKTYTLDVTVGNDGDNYKIVRAEVYSNADKADKTDTITNTYNTYDLTLDKTVDGLLGDKTKDFAFTIVFTNPDKSATSFQWAYDMDAQSPTYTTKNFDENGTATVDVNLAHGEDVIFKGLPEDVTYVITEAENYEYVASATGTGMDKNVADTNPSSENDKKVVYGDVKVDNAAQDVAVSYTNVNVNDETPATGIAMNVAPYALLVAVAGVACFFFLRKRRED